MTKTKEEYKGMSRQDLMDKAELRVGTKLRKKYQGLSRQELLDKAYQIGFDMEKNAGSCSQATVKTFHEFIEIPDDVVRVACSSCGGQAGRVQGTCGALLGGTMVLDYFFGRPAEHMSHEVDTEVGRDDVWYAMAMARLIHDYYIKEWGTIMCPQLQENVLGRCYSFWDPIDREEFFKAGSVSEPGKCAHIVGCVTRLVLEILIDRGIIKVES